MTAVSDRRAAVVTVSDRSFAGTREDRSGPVAVEALRDAGWACADAVVAPDGADAVRNAITGALASGARLIITSGGTGVGPRDRTPEGTRALLDLELPGIPEELRRRGAAFKSTAALTRGVAGVAGTALVVNLPGSPGGVESGIRFVLEIADHVLSQLDGGDH